MARTMEGITTAATLIAAQRTNWRKRREGGTFMGRNCLKPIWWGFVLKLPETGTRPPGARTEDPRHSARMTDVFHNKSGSGKRNRKRLRFLLILGTRIDGFKTDCSDVSFHGGIEFKQRPVGTADPAVRGRQEPSVVRQAAEGRAQRPICRLNAS